MTEPERIPQRDLRIAYGLVAAQFGLLALLALLPLRADWPRPGWLVALAAAAGVGGLLVMALGGTTLGRGLTAAPLPNEHAVLRTGGAYRYVRHPIYSGLLVLAAAIVVASGSLVRLGVLVLLVVLLNVKARWEEERLARRFAGYAFYAAHTPRFVPRPLPRRGSRKGR